jgi:putative ABC transport system substrate-binding protein
MAGAPAIVGVANRFGIPVIAGDPETFRAGCLAGLGVSYEELGIASARLADSILRGPDPGTLPVVISSEGFVMVNRTVAEELGVSLSEALTRRARVVIDSER